MEWTQILTIVLANFGMFLWSRKESRDDNRQMVAKSDAFREMWAQETKEFHGRLERQDAEFKSHIANHR